MSATAIVIRLLLEDSAVTAEPFPVVIPQTASLPCIVVNLVSEQQDHVIEGAQPVFDSRVSVACHGATPDEANDLGEAVKRCLEGVISWEVENGDSPPGIWGTATIWKAGSDMTDFNEQRTVFRRVIDWRVRWQRAD